MPVNTISYEQARFAGDRAPYQNARQPRRPRLACRALQLEPRLDLVKSGRPVSCDVEGVILPWRHETGRKGCGRVSVVNEDGQVILDTFTYYPAEEEVELPPAYLRMGVYWSDLKPRNGAQPVARVLEYVREVFDKSGTVVCHAIANEMAMLRELPWSQWQTRDTQKASAYMRYAKNPGNLPGLRGLTHQVLGESIQQKEHDSVEDAKATMKLYLLHKASIDREQSPPRPESLSVASAGSTTSHSDSSRSVVTASTCTSASQGGTHAPLAPGHLVALPNILALAKGRQFDKRNSRYL